MQYLHDIKIALSDLRGYPFNDNSIHRNVHQNRWINGAFPQTFVGRNDFPEDSRNIISSHKSLWKCHSHNKGFLTQKYPFIPARDFSFILCKYLHFICFVENLRTSLRKIYTRAGFFIYFMQIIAFYLFCRKSSNTLRKIYGRINEKFRAGINGYFYIQKTLHFNGNEYSADQIDN